MSERFSELELHPELAYRLQVWIARTRKSYAAECPEATPEEVSHHVLRVLFLLLQFYRAEPKAPDETLLP
jgi:hypothetical protein